MIKNKIIQGDCLEKLKELPNESINCCVTSPPYWALRDYGVVGQLGLEQNFNEYINKLCNIFDEVKRVLRKDGTCFVNIGDTYFGGGGGNYGKGISSKQGNSHPTNFLNKLKNYTPKCLVGIPFRFCIEMINRGWILRNTIIWYKPNCMPSSSKDRFTCDFEYVFFFVKNKKYFFETQYEPLKNSSIKRNKYAMNNSKEFAIGRNRKAGNIVNVNKGRNKRCVWKITTKSFKGSHFAVYPPDLIEPMIKAGCPEFICKKCGKPRSKIYEFERIETRPGKTTKYNDDLFIKSNVPKGLIKRVMCSRKEKGLTDCGCGSGFIKGIVIDPFFGAGTTGLVALQQNKEFVGIELNPEYIKLAEKRLKPFLKQQRLF